MYVISLQAYHCNKLSDVVIPLTKRRGIDRISTVPTPARYTAAIFAEVGKQTECFVRFSTVAGESGAADAERDIRGFAVKFYTEEGNWDLVGNNTPVFFLRDPHKFPDLNRAVKRDPETNLRSAENNWDFRADDSDDYTQPGKLFHLMSKEQQQVLFENTARNMSDCSKFIKIRHISNCLKADPAYGKGVADALGISLDKVE